MHNLSRQLSADFKVVVIHSNNIIDQEVERVWQEELTRTNGKVFNEQLLAFDAFEGQVLTGHFVEYKSYIAQIRGGKGGIKPVSISGYCRAGNYVLVGKRSQQVTDYSGFYELVPSGSIDPSSMNENSIDVTKQVRTELLEEAGIGAGLVKGVVATHLIECVNEGVYEICCRVEVDEQVLGRELKGNGDGEYTELNWIEKSEIGKFVEKNMGMIVPLSLELIEIELNIKSLP